MRYIFSLLLGTLLLFLSATHAAEIPEDILELARERVDSGHTMGMVIGIVDSEGVSYYGYGKMAASGEQVPSKDTVFEIGSVSKVFTATLLADAVKRGEVMYTDPIEKYLPDSVKAPTRKGKSITLEQLSVQTSGLPRMPKNFNPKNNQNPYVDYTVEDLYKALSKVKLKKDAGKTYAYSNFGVGLLGHLLERASGQSYEALTVTRIADVIGMPDTTITLSDDMKTRLAIGHSGKQEMSNWDIPTLAGAGAIRSTP